MEAISGSRVSGEFFCAVAISKDLCCYGTASHLANGSHMLAGFFWSGAGSGEGKAYCGGKQCEQKLERLDTFWMRLRQEAATRVCDMHNTGSSDCVRGKPRSVKVTKTILDLPWSRFAEMGFFFTVEDTVWTGSMEIPWHLGVFLRAIVQIWAYNIMIHRSNKGFGGYQRPNPQNALPNKRKEVWQWKNTRAGPNRKGKARSGALL